MLFRSLGTEFLPKLEEGNMWIRAMLPPTITLEAGMSSVARIRDVILSYPPVRTVVSEQGRGEDATDPDGSFVAEFFVPLKPFDEWAPGMTKDKLVSDLQRQFSNEFTGIGFNFSQYIQDNVEEGLSGVKGANSVKIIGRDLAKLEQIANEPRMLVSLFSFSRFNCRRFHTFLDWTTREQIAHALTPNDNIIAPTATCAVATSAALLLQIVEAPSVN